jgi:hypothetical protein
MRVDQGFPDAVEELRRLQTPIPTKADAIRAAVMKALNRVKAKSKAMSGDLSGMVIELACILRGGAS